MRVVRLLAPIVLLLGLVRWGEAAVFIVERDNLGHFRDFVKSRVEALKFYLEISKQFDAGGWSGHQVKDAMNKIPGLSRKIIQAQNDPTLWKIPYGRDESKRALTVTEEKERLSEWWWFLHSLRYNERGTTKGERTFYKVHSALAPPGYLLSDLDKSKVVEISDKTDATTDSFPLRGKAILELPKPMPEYLDKYRGPAWGLRKGPQSPEPEPGIAAGSGSGQPESGPFTAYQQWPPYNDDSHGQGSGRYRAAPSASYQSTPYDRSSQGLRRDPGSHERGSRRDGAASSRSYHSTSSFGYPQELGREDESYGHGWDQYGAPSGSNQFERNFRPPQRPRRKYADGWG